MKLSTIEKDVLSEFITIGFPEVKSDLSELFQKDINLNLPNWDLFQKDQGDEFSSDFPKTALIVEQSFEGKYNGKGVVITNKDQALDICHLVIPNETPDQQNLNADHKDLMKEITNIIINRIVCCVDNFVGDEHEFLVPYCVIGKPKHILKGYGQKSDAFPVLVMRSMMSIDGHEMELTIGLLFGKKDLEVLLELLRAKFPQYAKASA